MNFFIFSHSLIYSTCLFLSIHHLYNDKIIEEKNKSKKMKITTFLVLAIAVAASSPESYEETDLHSDFQDMSHVSRGSRLKALDYGRPASIDSQPYVPERFLDSPYSPQR